MELSGFPYFEVQFTKRGERYDPAQEQAVADAVAAGSITDLFVISHGWNNDMEEARALYGSFFAAVRRVLDAGNIPGAMGRRYGVLGIFWPSKKFAESELIAGGGAASAGNGMSAVDEAELTAQLDRLKGAFDAPDADEKIEAAKALLPRLEDSGAARDEFADLIRGLFPDSGELEEEIPRRFFADPGRVLIDNLGAPLPAEAPGPGPGGAAAIGEVDLSRPPQGGAAGLGSIFNKIKTGVQNLLNFTTYYQMKERAGVVGRGGVNDLLRTLRSRQPGLKIHLIGHSFGGRLVTAATDGPEGREPLVANSVTLLQAAFSHNGFSGDYDDAGTAGFFRKVVTDGKVSGPVLISHSSFDKAVGVAYPLASRIVGDAASGLGDASDKFGGMGRNGARKTAEASDGALLPVGGAYAFQGGRIYNLGADEYIKGHSDICGDEVAHALLTAVAST